MANATPIRSAWKNFVNSIKDLLATKRKDDRFLVPYLPFKKHVFEMVESERFLTDLEEGWTKSRGSSNDTAPEIKERLLEEVDIFPSAAEAAMAVKPDEAEKARKKTLGRASIVLESVKDILDELPWYAKGAIILFQELIDLFRG